MKKIKNGIPPDHKRTKKVIDDGSQVIFDLVFPDAHIDLKFMLMYLKIKRDIIQEKIRKEDEEKPDSTTDGTDGGD